MKLRSICKSKIHHATVTAADVNYIGSIGIDLTLMNLTGLVAGEQVEGTKVRRYEGTRVRVERATGIEPV